MITASRKNTLITTNKVLNDDSTLRDLLAKNLSKEGHLVSVAEDGKDALVQIGTTDYDLIITDILMPEKDGLELIQEVRRKGAGTRIIAMTGGGEGWTDYLTLHGSWGLTGC